jgi:hypothetical protein
MGRLISRRAFVAGAAAALAGCGDSELARTVVDAYRLTVIGHPDTQIDRDTVTNIQFASIAAKIGKGPRSLLILWRIERNDLHWLSADSAAVVTRHGRVVKTAGFPENLTDTRSSMRDPVELGLHKPANLGRFARQIDLDGPARYGVQIQSTFEPLGPRQISIAEIDFDTVVVRERCTATTLNWSFTNDYWVDPADGFVWRSRQTIARGFPPIIIEILKPAA